MAVVAAVVVVVAVDRVGKAPMLLADVVVRFCVVVSYNIAVVILPMFVHELSLIPPASVFQRGTFWGR